MIFSEKQIMQMFVSMMMQIRDLEMMKSEGRLTETGQSNLDAACRLVTEIQNQQSEELRETND